MSALAGTIAAPWAGRGNAPGIAQWLRVLVSSVAAIAILAVALPVAFGAGMGSTGSSPLRVFSSGPAVAVDASGGARLSVDGLVPGQSRTATIHVSNAGSAASLALSARTFDKVGPGGVALSSLLRLRIVAPEGDVLYAGPVADLSRLRLGRIAAGGSRSLRVTATLPSSAGNEVSGSALSATFAWSATA